MQLGLCTREEDSVCVFFTCSLAVLPGGLLPQLIYLTAQPFPQCTPPVGKEHIFPSPRKGIVIPVTPGLRAASSLRNSVWVQLWHTRKNSSSQWGPCSLAPHIHHRQHTHTLCTAELPPHFCAYFCIDNYRGLSLAPLGRVLGFPESGISSNQKNTLWLKTSDRSS